MPYYVWKCQKCGSKFITKSNKVKYCKICKQKTELSLIAVTLSERRAKQIVYGILGTMI